MTEVRIEDGDNILLVGTTELFQAWADKNPELGLEGKFRIEPILRQKVGLFQKEWVVDGFRLIPKKGA